MRSFEPGFGASAAFITAAAFTACAANQPIDERPNFVVILADDMGYGDASVYDGWIEMPQLERMAAQGLVFTDFHTSGVVCSPTRAGLLTGRYQQRAGIPGVINADPKLAAHHVGIQPIERTFAEALRDAGYATGIFGKWHLGYHAEFNPTLHGFDEFRGFVSGNIDYISHYDRMQQADWWRDAELSAEPGYATHLVTEHATRFIDSHADRPFCLYVPHGAPHAPIQAPDSPAQRGPSHDPSRGAADPRPRDERTVAMMRALDRSVGSILDALDRNGIADRTLVVFLSDNGGARHMRNDPLRGGKGSVWEGGHRVPAIATWPGRIPDGTRTAELASSLDLMPTMLELAGVAAAADRPFDGESLVPLFEGRGRAERKLYWNGIAMRDGPWKLIMRRNKPAELYRVDTDIGERENIAAAHPDRVRAMSADLGAWRADVRSGTTPQPGAAAFEARQRSGTGERSGGRSGGYSGGH